MTNPKTTISTIITVLGLIPLAVTQFGLADVSPVFVKISLACSVIAFIYKGVQTQDAK